MRKGRDKRAEADEIRDRANIRTRLYKVGDWIEVKRRSNLRSIAVKIIAVRFENGFPVYDAQFPINPWLSRSGQVVSNISEHRADLPDKILTHWEVPEDGG